MVDSKISEDVVWRLIKTFFRGSLKFKLELNDIKAMNWNTQESFLKSTVYNLTCKKYPVNNEFQRLFFKKLISYLESHQEIHDDLYKSLCSAMDRTLLDNICYRHYIICNDLNNIITMKETKNLVVNGTTGMRTWEAAVMLADWALCNKDIFIDRKILELGSGVGFTGITITKLCRPFFTLMTDNHQDVLKTICDNVQINFPRFELEEAENTTYFKEKQLRLIGTMMLDWNDIEKIPIDLIPDILIGADIVYDPAILKPLCEVIQKFYKRNKTLEVYIASVIRNEETFNSFLILLGTLGFTYDRITQDQSVCIDWDVNVEKCLLRIRSQ